MCKVTDFYQYKYSRENYFINIFISKESARGIELLLKEKLKEKKLSREYRCAYTVLKNKFSININNSTYFKLRINKCYLQYLKDLYYDFYHREESVCIKEVICHIQYFIESDMDSIDKFYGLMENTKINVLSKM